MDSDIALDLSPMLRVYKDGRVERLMGTATVAASLDEKTGVQSKDVTISLESGLSARLYIPKPGASISKLPLLVYYHGGGFCIETVQSPTYHNYLNSLVCAANVVVVSIEYRRAPENPIPIAYDDSWAALKWVGSHSGGTGGPDEWLNTYADFTRVYVAGDSAGANIAHRMSIMFGLDKIEGIDVRGSILVHPYFWGTEPMGSELAGGFVGSLWKLTSPNSSGLDDPYINPAKDPNLSRLGCSRVLVAVAEKDILKDRGWFYCDVLKKSGWTGEVQVMEAKGEAHVFHLSNPTCDNAVALMNRVSTFLNNNQA